MSTEEMKMRQRVVVLGAGYAGMLAALRLGGRAERLGAAVTLVNDSDEFVERIRLHQTAAAARPAGHAIRRMLRGTPVQFVQARVTAIDPARRELTLSAAGGESRLGYDFLIDALGSSADLDSVPGVRQYATGLEAGGAARLRARLASVPAGARLLVCGGGLTGIEAASEIAQAWPGVWLELVARGPIGEGLSEKGRRYVQRRLEQLGVRVREGVSVVRVDADSALADSGERLPFDVCLWAGSFAASPLAAQAGFAVDGRGRMLVDGALRSISHPEVLGAGDAAVFAGPGGPLRMACATAMPMGAHAADCVSSLLAGNVPLPFRFGFVLQCISLGRGDGLVQFVDAHDAPRERILTGRAAAIVKEAICRYTTLSLRLERWHSGFYRWSQGAALPAAQRQAVEARSRSAA